MRVSLDQVKEAVDEARGLTDDQLRVEAKSGRSRSYFIMDRQRPLPMKAIVRLAYIRANIKWDGPQSLAVANALRGTFDILHSVAEVEQERLDRQRENVERWKRDGKFRAALLDLFGSTCAISGCKVLDAIDASHILGVADEGDDDVTNGWIIRTDLHRLFDVWLMSIDPTTGRVHMSPDCMDSYAEFNGRTVTLPKGAASLSDFAPHWAEFQKRTPA